MIVAIIIAAVLAVLGIVVLIGKGDMLIAGYNTASKEERQQYDIKRIRLVIGLLMLILAVACPFLLGIDDMSAHITFYVIVTVLSIVAVVLANTWAKKKRK